MRMDKLTTEFQAALADAQSVAVGRDNRYIEPVHLMAALLDQQGRTARPLLEKAGVNVPRSCARSSRLRSTACPQCKASAAMC